MDWTRRGRIAALIALGALLAACTDTADLSPMNEAANQAGTPSFEFRRGLPYGPVKVTMADGEVLNGRFRVMDNSTVGVGFAGGVTATAVGFGGNRIVFISARGDRGTSINCQGAADFGGHGGGVCETNHGARYQVMF
jgi:hypothetical protein